MNKILLGVFVFAIVGLLTLGAVNAMPDFGKQGCQGIFADNSDAIQQAIADADYDSWKSLIEASLTEDNFNSLVERYNEMSEMNELNDEMKQAWDDDDFAKVKELQEEIKSKMPEQGNMSGDMRPEMKEPKEGFFQRFMFWNRD